MGHGGTLVVYLVKYCRHPVSSVSQSECQFKSRRRVSQSRVLIRHHPTNREKERRETQLPRLHSKSAPTKNIRLSICVFFSSLKVAGLRVASCRCDPNRNTSQSSVIVIDDGNDDSQRYLSVLICFVFLVRHQPNDVHDSLCFAEKHEGAQRFNLAQRKLFAKTQRQWWAWKRGFRFPLETLSRSPVNLSPSLRFVF